MSEELQPVFSIEKLYVKDMSLEVPHAPKIFLEQGEPEVDMRVSTESTKLEDEFYEVSVTVTVTAKLEDGRVMFLPSGPRPGFSVWPYSGRRHAAFAGCGLPEDFVPICA